MLKELFKKYESFLASKNIKVKFSDEEKMISAKLKDGGEIKTTAESWAVGVPVMGADGNPAPDGEYVLEDGTVVTVAGGALSEIEAPEPSDMTAEEMAEALEVIAAEQESVIETLTEEKENLAGENEQLKNEKTAMAAQIKDLEAKVKSLSKLPADKSQKHKRAIEDVKPEKMSRVESILKAMYETK